MFVLLLGILSMPDPHLFLPRLFILFKHQVQRTPSPEAFLVSPSLNWISPGIPSHCMTLLLH